MTYEYDPARFPPEIEAYFRVKFPENLWELEESWHSAPISEFEWQLRAPFWKTQKGYSFNLCPIEVLSNQDKFEAHYQRILNAQTSYPLTVSSFGGRLVILDGIHRLARSYLEGAVEVDYGFVASDKLHTRRP